MMQKHLNTFVPWSDLYSRNCMLLCIIQVLYIRNLLSISKRNAELKYDFSKDSMQSF